MNGKDIIDDENQEFYLSTKDEKEGFIVYVTEPFKLSERDIINLIKICLINARDKTIGKKILAIYRDATAHKKHIVQEKLKLIGITDETKPSPEKLGKRTKIR
jgi:hypothetical protein